MNWPPDNPEIPIKKPRAIARLEKMDFHTLEAMPPVEIDEVSRDLAQGVAEEYSHQKGANFDDCIDMVSIALTETGSAIGGKVGSHMIGKCDKIAHDACRLAFPDKNELF